MKKVFALILALLYMGTSTGASLHMHYCMGKLIDVKLWHKEKVSKCNKCSSTAHTKCAKKCCKDEHKSLQVDKDQQLTNSAIDAAQQVAITVTAYNMELRPMAIPSLMVAFPVSNAPPRNCKVPAHILYCTYRI